MTIETKYLSQQLKVATLFRHIITTIAVHFFAAASLIVLVLNSTQTEHLFSWSSLLVGALLVQALIQTMFNRMYASEQVNPKKWENINALTSLLVSSVFSMAYCYLAISGNLMLWSSLSLLMVMHLSCVIFTSFSSRKVILCSVLPITLPFATLLFLSSMPSAAMFATSISVYSCIILIVSFDLHLTLLNGFEMESKYLSEMNENGQLKEKLTNTTFEDPETQILNKRFFDLMIDEEIRRAKRAGKTLSIALIGINHLDEYLDNYGEQKTSKCIQQIAKILSDATPRGGEFITRFSKDKFALIAPNVQLSDMTAFTNKMDVLVQQANIEHLYSPIEDSENMSICAGIAEFTPGKIIDVDELVMEAGDALRAAKLACGNNVHVKAANITPEDADESLLDIDDIAPAELDELATIS